MYGIAHGQGPIPTLLMNHAWHCLASSFGVIGLVQVISANKTLASYHHYGSCAVKNVCGRQGIFGEKGRKG